MKPIFNKENLSIPSRTNLQHQISHKKTPIASVKKNIDFYALKLTTLTKDGIETLKDKDKKKYIRYFYKNANPLKYAQFIPASSDEEKMFQDLQQFYKEYNPKIESFGHYINKTKKYDFLLFFKHLRKFPFYPFLKKNFLRLETMGTEEKKVKIAQTLLYGKDFNYATCPKAFIPFHTNGQKPPFTAFEEHLLQFQEFSSQFDASEFHCSFKKESQPFVQKKLKDMYTSHFFNSKNSSIVLSFCDKEVKSQNTLPQFQTFVSNLNSIDADIVYINTMDNLGSAKIQKKKSLMNKVLCGKLLNAQHQLFQYLQKIDAGNFSETDYKNLFGFLEKEFHWDTDKLTKTEKTTQLHSFLNRPLRICAVIPLSQEEIDKSLEAKNRFTPVFSQKEDLTEEKETQTCYMLVEMWCAVKTYKGEKFDLSNFTEESQQEISLPLSPLHPLLLESEWYNENMKNWNSIFVEIDPQLYTPVKIINDLLSNDHQ